MAVSRAMRRLLQVLEIQEERSRAAMESARAAMLQLQESMAQAAERERLGRCWVTASARSGEKDERIAGLEESRLAKRHIAALAQRTTQAEKALEASRQELLSKRMERRQTQTLIGEAEARERVETERRAQRDLDDWFLGRRGIPPEEQNSKGRNRNR